MKGEGSGSRTQPPNGDGAHAPAAASRSVWRDKKQQVVKSGFFSGDEFADLPLSEPVLAALATLDFTTTTKIQAS